MTDQRPIEEDVPRSLRIGAAYGWRLLILLAVGAAFAWLVIQFKLLVIPMLVGLLITALLWPAMSWLLKHRVPKWLATVLVLLLTTGIVTFLGWLVNRQVRAEWSTVEQKSIEAWDGYVVYFTNLAKQLGFDPAQVTDWVGQFQTFIEGQLPMLFDASLAFGFTVGHIATGAVLSVFILICLLADGGSIWRWTLNLFPKKAQPAVNAAAFNGWTTVVNYARTQLLVASVDAVGIGLGAFLLGVPMAVPVAVLVFLGAFVPIVGAIVTGSIAVLLALVYNGFWNAVFMLAVVLLVQQIEGHVLQPLVMGHAVKVHPLAIVLVVAGGTMVAGIPGALFAVPIAAFINVAWLTISSGSWKTGEPVDPEQTLWYTVETRSPSGDDDEPEVTDTGTVKVKAKPRVKRTSRTITKRTTRKKPRK